MEIEVGYQACIHPDMVSQHGRRLVEPAGRRAKFWAQESAPLGVTAPKGAMQDKLKTSPVP